MMSGPLLRDRVKETATTTGTGALTLLGAAIGFRSFAAVGDGNSCYYCIEDGTNWEVGVGTYTASGTSLSRDSVLASSNNGSAVDFPAGTKNVFLALPAAAVAAGTVTSVNASGGATGFSFSGGPVTSSGTVTLTGTLALASGGTGATTAAGARTNLGLGTAATSSTGDFDAAGAAASAVIVHEAALDPHPGYLTASEGNAAYQPLDAELSALAGLTSAADKLPYFTGSGTAAVTAFTSAGRALVDDADAAAQRTTLGLGTAATSATTAFDAAGAASAAQAASQPLDSELTALAGLTSAADKLPYFTGSGTAAVTAFTAAGRALVDDADAAAQRTTLGLAAIASSGSASDLSSGTVPAARLTTFVAAGGSHAAGAVPDPGATAHTNVPYLLGDMGAFVLPAGKLLGASYVTTDESTTSTTPVDLTTADSVSFTLDATQTVAVVFLCNVYHASNNRNCSSTIFYDGTQDSNTDFDIIPGETFGSVSASGMALGTKSLASGAHTVKVEHYSPNANAAHFRRRLLLVFLVS